MKYRFIIVIEYKIQQEMILDIMVAVGWLVGWYKGGYLSPYSPKSNMTISISTDSLTQNKQKEKQDKLIYTYWNI